MLYIFSFCILIKINIKTLMLWKAKSPSSKRPHVAALLRNYHSWQEELEWQTARTVWRFGQVEAEEMVGLRTILFVTHDQLSSLSTAVAVILMGLFALCLQLTLLGLELSIAHLLFSLHNHCTLQEVKQCVRQETDMMMMIDKEI